jgi:RNA polymerase sigma-70 factor (ECF subfamily)
MSAPPAPLPARSAGRVVTRLPDDRPRDALLVAAAARGDRDAIGAIWDRYSPFVRSVVRSALGSSNVVDDLVQEVFLAFVRGAKHINDGSLLRSYLAGVAVRLAAMEIRRNKVRRWVTLSPTGELPEQPSMPGDVFGREALRALEHILSKLSTRRRMAFVLRDVEGLEMLDVAAALAISESTLRRELMRAREIVLASASREPALSHFLQHDLERQP